MNESDEAYARRMEIKALMDAPRGTRFQARRLDETKWIPSESPIWNFNVCEYRIAPTAQESPQ